MNHAVNQPITFLTTKEVMQRTGMSRTALYERRLSDPDFPKPVKLGEGTGRQLQLRWVESELEEWMQSMMAKRE